MRPWLLPLFVAILLPGCGSDALTENECRAIQDKELAYLSATFSAMESPRDGALDKGKVDRGLAACLTGTMYSREDYECLIGVRTNAQVGQCLATAHEHLP